MATPKRPGLKNNHQKGKKPMNVAGFARDEYKDLTIYKELVKSETSPEFKKILNSLIKHEQDHFEFWKGLSEQKEFSINPLTVWFYKFTRKVLGLTFTAKLLEKHEKEAIEHYREFLKTAQGDVKKKVKKILEHELDDEKLLIAQIEEPQVEFISSIILGLNDGLIELTGVLVGFSFAFTNHNLVALTGLITGIAASMSMASSAYMQARHEEGKDAIKAGVFTGVSYLIVVLLLIFPFFITANLYLALPIMIIIVLLIIISISYYTAILFDRKFVSQFLEMFIFSIVVATIAALIGFLFKNLTGINI